jgi:hypothetical protein
MKWVFRGWFSLARLSRASSVFLVVAGVPATAVNRIACIASVPEGHRCDALSVDSGCEVKSFILTRSASEEYASSTSPGAWDLALDRAEYHGDFIELGSSLALRVSMKSPSRSETSRRRHCMSLGRQMMQRDNLFTAVAVTPACTRKR